MFLNFWESILNINDFFHKITSYNFKENSTLYHFLRTGICILSTVCLASIAVAFVFSTKQNNVSRQAMSHIISEKKLPIYCVDTDKPKIALSFDAAWGNIILMNF